MNYTVALVIEGVAPLNGSRVGGTELTITGSGFARLGPMNNVTVGGVPCVPKTLKNLACRLSPFDSGQPCAWTSGAGAFAGAAADAIARLVAVEAQLKEQEAGSRAEEEPRTAGKQRIVIDGNDDIVNASLLPMIGFYLAVGHAVKDTPAVDGTNTSEYGHVMKL